jgi:hypothetical protein
LQIEPGVLQNSAQHHFLLPPAFEQSASSFGLAVALWIELVLPTWDKYLPKTKNQ